LVNVEELPVSGLGQGIGGGCKLFMVVFKSFPGSTLHRVVLPFPYHCHDQCVHSTSLAALRTYLGSYIL